MEFRIFKKIVISFFLFFVFCLRANAINDELIKENLKTLENTEEQEDSNYSEVLQVEESDIFKDKIKEALKGEVHEIETKGLLNKYFHHEFKSGILKEALFETVYRGYFSNSFEQNDSYHLQYLTNYFTTRIDGKFRNSKLGFRTQFNLAPTSDGLTFFNDFWRDQYLYYDMTKNDRIYLGYKQYHNGIEGGTSAKYLTFIIPSQLARAYGTERNLGVTFEGNHKYFNYSTGFYSSSRHFQDWFPGVEFIIDGAVKPLAKFGDKYGELLLGAGTMMGGYDGKQYKTVNGYMEYKYKRLTVTFEGGFSDGSNGLTRLNTNRTNGFNTTIAYRITPKLEGMIAYDIFNNNADFENNARKEYICGINYYIKGQALKLMINYIFHNSKNEDSGSLLFVGTQITL